MPNYLPEPLLSPNPAYAGTGGQVVYWGCPPAPGRDLPGNVRAKNGLITNSYATREDLFAISVGEDQTFDFSAASVERWLGIAAGKINQYLGQRFRVPLTYWSDTVVEINCELAYIGITRRRGRNTEESADDFAARAEEARLWLESSRDHMITPDERLSVQDQPVQALRYLASPSRGWEGGGVVWYARDGIYRR